MMAPSSRCPFVVVLLLSHTLPGCGHQVTGPSDAPDAVAPVAFEGPSTDLKRTVIVPTLDSAMPPGKNVVWCASFQVAWNQLKDNICKEPIALDQAQDMADALNRAPPPEPGLPEGSYYAAAGWVQDGIVETIRDEMQKRFGRQPAIRFDPEAPGGLTAYAYLQARVKFDIPFFENREPFEFRESGGENVRVSSFGLPAKNSDAYGSLRRQIDVLHCRALPRANEQDEFVIDLCRTSSPSQLIVAYVRPKATLAATIEDVRAKVKASAADRGHDREFGWDEQLLVPNVNFRIEHEFRELKGARFRNAATEGLVILAALQDIRFRLDRSGAELESEAALPCAAIPRFFFVKGPFLVYLQRRGSERPYFALWVDNAELLCKTAEAG